MRRALLALIAALTLGGCSILQDAYDDQARDDCDNRSTAGERGSCYDNVDQNSRERRQQQWE